MPRHVRTTPPSHIVPETCLLFVRLERPHARTIADTCLLRLRLTCGLMICRWARLRRTPENEHRPDADFETHKMVMNVGLRPTLADGAGLTVEAHVLHRYSANFYGEPLRVIATGFLRCSDAAQVLRLSNICMT